MTHKLRTHLALRLAPWLKPKQPAKAEWTHKVSSPTISGYKGEQWWNL